MPCCAPLFISSSQFQAERASLRTPASNTFSSLKATDDRRLTSYTLRESIAPIAILLYMIVSSVVRLVVLLCAELVAVELLVCEGTL